MKEIVYQTELKTRDRLGLDDDEPINLENDRHSEAWREEMESAVRRQGVPYYEDLDEE